MAGETFSDAIYASFALYFINPVSDSYNILIEIARWGAAIATTTTVLFAVKRFWSSVVCFVECHSKDSIAVYSDKDINIRFNKPRRSVLYLGRDFKAAAKSHIIMLDRDEDCLKFYHDHEKVLRNKKVYIGLQGAGFSLLKDNLNISFFDIDNAIARILWKKIALWDQNRYKLEIVVLGAERRGRSILKCGLMMNIFSQHQEINYYLVGKSKVFYDSYGDIVTYNSDKVCCLETDNNIPNLIRRADIVIMSHIISLSELQELSDMCSQRLYYYSPENTIEPYINFPNAEAFGYDSEIYTDENIRGNKLVSAAIDQHYEYLTLTGVSPSDKNSEWNKLSGFIKMSNISSSDFVSVLRLLNEKGVSLEAMAELEHIRWCRFHILEHWQYGIPDNGKSKDGEKKIHKAICKFSELDEEDKEKDRSVVRKALDI